MFTRPRWLVADRSRGRPWHLIGSAIIPQSGPISVKCLLASSVLIPFLDLLQEATSPSSTS